MADLVEDRVISEEYKLWKKNVPFLYDYMMTRALEWPSPIVQWFPETEILVDDTRGIEFTNQRLLLGTNTQTEENYLTITSVQLPVYDDEREQKDIYTMKENEFGAFAQYADKYNYEIKIPHQGAVKSAQYMPSNTNLIATKSDNDLFIYDISECKDDVDCNNEYDCVPMFEFKNLNTKSELAWNPYIEGLLLTGYRKDQLAIWDINSASNNGRKSSSSKRNLKPKNKYTDDIETITDVAWHQFCPTVFGSSTNEGRFCLWDIRSKDTSRPSHTVNAHKFEISSMEFNPGSEYLLATSSPDRSIALWDLRNLKLKLHSICLREEWFHRIRWCPYTPSVLAACNNDRRVHLFDLQCMFDDQTPTEAEEGPSSLIFTHHGHASSVYDISWNPNELMICSVSDDNVIQCWQIMSKFLPNLPEKQENPNEKSASG